MSVQPKFVSRPIPKRKLTPSNVASLNVAIPGLGKFALQGVGSTMRSGGFHGTFQPEGADEPLRGHVPLKCRIGDDFKIVWFVALKETVVGRPGPRRNDDNAYPQPVIDAMLAILSELPQRYETGLMFDVMDEAFFEVREYDYAVRTMQDSIVHLTEFLKSKCPPDRIEIVKNNLAKTETKLARLQSEGAERIPKLRTLVAAIRLWCEQKPSTSRQSFMDLYTEALGLDVAAPAPGVAA